MPRQHELWISFDIHCADDLRDPNGASHPKTRAQDFAKLMPFLLKTEGILLETPVALSLTSAPSVFQRMNATILVFLSSNANSITLAITFLRLTPRLLPFLYGMVVLHGKHRFGVDLINGVKRV
jgi:hypothetical protein